MTTTSPARIDDDLYASAKLAGEVQSRSASQQVAHWARIGREIEASATISHKDIAEVLGGSRSYDSLSAKEQAVVRAEWSTRMDVARAALNFARQFEAEGRTWVELDDDGAVVEGPKVDAGRQGPKAGEVGRGGKVVTKTTGTGKVAAKSGKRTAALKQDSKQNTAPRRNAGAGSGG